MDLETAQTSTTAKLPILKQENGNSFIPVTQTTTNADGTSTSLIPDLVTTEEKVQKKNDVNVRMLQAQSILTPFSTGFRRLNKPDLDIMSFDDLYKNLKIVKQKVKRTASSSSSS
ncbi:hypothetical protein Tco_1441270 [Tanacetum coccineum]